MTKAMTPEQKATKAREKKMKGMIAFIEKMNAKNPGMFDWDGFVYVGTQAVDCTLKCVKHGEFTKKANALAKAKYPCDGCKKDALIENFIQKGRSMYGDQYDYSEVDGVDQDRVWITCTVHDERFEQIAKNHFKWLGCQHCSEGDKDRSYRQEKRFRVNDRPRRQQEFINDIEFKWPNTYDFSQVNYVDKSTPVILFCKNHDFQVIATPDAIRRRVSRTRKSENNYCCRKGADEGLITTKDEFLFRAREMHGMKYDYPNLPDLVPAIEKVDIICPDHGLFRQRSVVHSYNRNGTGLGSGCPQCTRMSNGEETLARLLNEAGVRYEFQHCFDDLPNRYFDFYLETGELIEYDGVQHYRPVEYFGGQKAFDTRVKRDKEKDQYAKENGLILHRIRYDQNIKEELDKILN